MKSKVKYIYDCILDIQSHCDIRFLPAASGRDFICYYFVAQGISSSTEMIYPPVLTHSYRQATLPRGTNGILATAAADEEKKAPKGEWVQR